MPNHVIKDRLWASKKLARCSKEAALAYPWIFLVADDHGRFEYHPRRIWGMAFSGRDDVSAEDVTRWLEEYQREELLVRYGADLAYWTNFEGRPPTKRRASLYPTPPEPDPTAAKPERGGAESVPIAEQSVAEQETERSVAEGRVEYVRAVWSEFQRITNRPDTELMGTIEYDLASRWWADGIPFRVVLSGMEGCPKKREARRLSYFASSVKEAADRQRRTVA